MKKMNCPKNPILMMRNKNLVGPLFQKLGNGKCVKGTGNYKGKNGPGS